MKYALSAAVGFLLLVETVCADSQLLKLQVAHEKREAEIATAFQTKMESLGKHYSAAIEKLMDQVKESADLDQVLAVKKELERFEKKPVMPDELDQHPGVRGLQAKFKEQSDRYRADLGKERSALTKSYSAALDKLERELVRAGRIADAMAARAERKKIFQAELRNSGVVAYFPFDEDEGEKVADASPAGRSATANRTEWVAGRAGRGGAIRFDGSAGGFIAAEGVTATTTPAGHTWSLWFKTDGKWDSDGKTGGSGRGHAILIGQNQARRSLHGARLSIEAPENALRFCINDTEVISESAGRDGGGRRETVKVADSRWHHVAVTFHTKGDRPVVVYLNGEDILHYRTTRDWKFGDGTTVIGANKDPYWEEFAGEIDDVMIFNRALSESEVREIYQSQR